MLFRSYGSSSFYDSSATTFYRGGVQGSTTTAVRLVALNTAGTYLTEVNTSSTVPMTWATGDIFVVWVRYEAAADGT